MASGSDPFSGNLQRLLWTVAGSLLVGAVLALVNMHDRVILLETRLAAVENLVAGSEAIHHGDLEKLDAKLRGAIQHEIDLQCQEGKKVKAP